MLAKRTAIISLAIEKVAGRYCKRVWWADKVELMQEAWVAVLESNEWNVEDEDLPYYVDTVAKRRIGRWLWCQSSPATGTRGGRHLAGLQRAEIPVKLFDPTHSADVQLELYEAELAVGVLRDRVVRRMCHVYKAGHSKAKRPNFTALEGVVLVLIDGMKPVDSARITGLPVKQIYSETTWVKREVLNDPMSYGLLRKIGKCQRLQAHLS